MIVIVTQTFAPTRGGMEGTMTGLAEHLAATGHQVAVFADAPAANLPTYTPNGFTLFRFSGWRPLRRLHKRAAIAAFAATHKIEGIYCDSWKSISAVPTNIKVPLAVLAHGADYPPEPSAFKALRIRAALKRATSLIANSRYTATSLSRFLPQTPDPRLALVHPPVEPLPDPTPEQLAPFQSLIAGRSPVLSTLCRFEPRKGVDRVIESLPTLLKDFPNLVFLAGGIGADEPRLRQLAQNLNVADRVVFTGPLGPEKAALYKLSDVFAMPVRQIGRAIEGYGITYIEAGLFGTATVGGRSGGVPDAVLDGETGLLCDGDSVADVTATLSRLLHDAPLRQRLGAGGHAHAHKDCTWVATLPRYLAALK